MPVQSIVDAEWKIIYDKLEKCVASGAQIILSRLPIGDLATQYFADRGLFCAGRVPDEVLPLFRFIFVYVVALLLCSDCHRIHPVSCLGLLPLRISSEYAKRLALGCRHPSMESPTTCSAPAKTSRSDRWATSGTIFSQAVRSATLPPSCCAEGLSNSWRNRTDLFGVCDMYTVVSQQFKAHESLSFPVYGTTT